MNVIDTVSVVALVLMASIIPQKTLNAESVSEAMRVFGLAGTWAADCAASPGEPTGKRVKFTTPVLGSSQMDNGQESRAIRSATRVTDEKIKIQIELKPVETQRLATEGVNVDTFGEVFVKNGNKLIVDKNNQFFSPALAITFLRIACQLGPKRCATQEEAEKLYILERCLN